MNQAFNPNAGVVNDPSEIDFAQVAANVKRQRMMADMLRKQATESAGGPQGQMVSGHYVAPSILQHLAPLLQQYTAGQADTNAARAEADAASQASQAAQKWQAGLPQALAAQMATDPPQDIGGNMIQGPEYEKTPAQRVSTGQILKAAMSGMRIPGNEKHADVYLKGALADQTREDSQDFRRETREDTQTARREQAEADRRQQAALQAERLQQQAEIARQRSEDLRYSVDQRREQAREVARLTAEMKLAVANSKPGKPIPNSVHKELSELENTAGSLSGLSASFKPEYSGLVASAKNAAAPYDPTGTLKTEGAEWWKEYAKSAQLVERHAMFGATLTPSEQTAWRAADINDAMDPKIIEKNLARRATLAKKLYSNAVARREVGGYPNIREVFDAEEVRPNIESDKPGRPPAAERKTIGGKTYEKRGGQWYPL